MSFEPNQLAQFVFRAGYHAWRHVCAPHYKFISAKAEALEVKTALQVADQIAKDHGGLDRGVQEARARMESRAMGVKLQQGVVLDLVRGLEPYFKNQSNKQLWGWWRAGLNVAALELLSKDKGSQNTNRGDADIQRGIHDSLEALLVSLGLAGMPTPDQNKVKKLIAEELNGWINQWIGDHHPLPGDPDLILIKAQHAGDAFPDEALLRKLGCKPAGIEFLRLLYDRRPEPVSYDAASEHFKVSPNAFAQRIRDIPKPVKDILLMDKGPNKPKAWRPLPTD